MKNTMSRMGRTGLALSLAGLFFVNNLGNANSGGFDWYFTPQRDAEIKSALRDANRNAAQWQMTREMDYQTETMKKQQEENRAAMERQAELNRQQQRQWEAEQARIKAQSQQNIPQVQVQQKIGNRQIYQLNDSYIRPKSDEEKLAEQIRIEKAVDEVLNQQKMGNSGSTAQSPQPVEVPRQIKSLEEDMAFVCNDYEDKDQDGSIFYPTEYRGAGRWIYSLGEPVTFVLVVYGRKNAVITYKIIRGKEDKSEELFSNGIILTRENSAINFNLQEDLKKVGGKVEPGSYRVDWFLNGSTEAYRSSQILIDNKPKK